MNTNTREAREQAVREAKSGIILDAARTVFAQKGYHVSRLEDIAEQAGFSKASLYNYYADKEEIFLTLAIREYEVVVERMEREFDPGEGFLENFEKMLTIIFSHFGQHFAFILTTSNVETVGLLHAEVFKHEKLTERFRRGIEKISEMFAAAIQAARKRGEIASTTDAGYLAGFIGALIKGVLYKWKLQGRMGDSREAVENILDFISRGVGFQGTT